MKEARQGMLLVISGPSGTGKGTLCSRLLQQDDTMRFSVSVTTRPARVGEIDGVHYFFISNTRYDQLLAEDAFLEHATVHGHRYGTLRCQVEDAVKAGINILLDIDPQGALNIMRQVKDCVTVFILPPSYQILEARLHTRNTDDPQEIKRRLAAAGAEVAQIRKYQYCVINDDLELALQRLTHIVEAEKQRTIRYCPAIPRQ